MVNSQSKKTAQVIRTIRLDDAHVTEILDRLESEAALTASASGGRAKTRYAYRRKGVVFHLQQPGSNSSVPYLAPTRDLSDDGISFLHGGFVHVGTRCAIQLITTHGTWNNVVGTVKVCTYLESNVHEVNVDFDQTIDLAEYCAEAVQSRVLLADDDPSIVQLAKFHLEQLNASVDHAENGEVAIEMAMNNTYDAILMDMDMPVLDGFEATKQLRSKGYSGLIIAATGMTGDEDRKRCLEAGCDRYLPKPFMREDLSQLLMSMREEPLYSTLADDPHMIGLIESFVVELPQRVRELEVALVSKDLKLVEQISRTLKSRGTSYGYEIITELAGIVETRLIAGDSIENTKPDIDKLLKMCAQARAPRRPKTDAADAFDDSMQEA